MSHMAYSEWPLLRLRDKIRNSYFQNDPLNFFKLTITSIIKVNPSLSLFSSSCHPHLTVSPASLLFSSLILLSLFIFFLLTQIDNTAIPINLSLLDFSISRSDGHDYDDSSTVRCKHHSVFFSLSL